MKEDNNKRKIEHVEIALSQQKVDRNRGFFDAINLSHRALPEIDFKDVDPSTLFLNHKLSFPLLISAMTGGAVPQLFNINKNLALAVEKTNIAMSVGSQRVAFDSEDAKKSFCLREFAPNALLFANLGAVQLNYGFGIKQCQYVVDLLGANALVFHLNPLQEIIQLEGNTNFSNLIEKIASIRDKISVPVIIKEVGCGFSIADAKLALKYDLSIIDIAGRGGSSWSLIEHHRNNRTQSHNDMGETFADWGIPTPIALKNLRKHSHKLTLIASGGIRNGIDMVKASVLGASLSGVALPFLRAATESSQNVINIIENFEKEFRTAMFLLGAQSTSMIYNNNNLLLKDD